MNFYQKVQVRVLNRLNRNSFDSEKITLITSDNYFKVYSVPIKELIDKTIVSKEEQF